MAYDCRACSWDNRNSFSNLFLLQIEAQCSNFIRCGTQLLGRAKSILPDEVSILYEGKPIANIVRLNYIIWNSGNYPIRHDDIVPNSPITIVIGETGSLLKASILRRSSPQNDVKIRNPPGDTRTVELSFLYLELGQGCNIELLYEGELSANPPSGTVIGMPKGLRPIDRDYEKRKETRIDTISVLATVIIILEILFSLAVIANASSSQTLGEIIGITNAVLIFVGGGAVLWIIRAILRLTFLNQIPSDLETQSRDKSEFAVRKPSK